MGRRKIDEMLLSAFGWVPARVALGMLTFFGFVNQFMVRVNLSVAIVAMVHQNKTVEEVQAQCVMGSLYIHGVAWPSMHALLSRWIPPIERPRFIAFAYLATTLSVTFTLPLCGVIIDWHGWEAVFYTTGVLCLIWCLLWFALMHDSPGTHPRISHEEREHIEMSVAAGGSSKRTGSGIPWRPISTSMPVWAIIVCDMGNTFGLSIYLTQLPTYMRNVLGFSIKKNGLLSGLPFLCRYVGGIISSTVGDWLLSRGCLSIVNTRRIFSAVAMLGPTVVLVGVAYSGCDPALTVSLLCLSMFLNGAITTSQLVNHTDIAPNFSGTLFGISNTFASIASFISPVAVAAIIKNQQTMTQWHNVFWMCVPIYAACEIFYLAFCSGTVQPWNYAGQHRRHAQEEEAERDGPEAAALQ
ncbi:sialin-like [Penaeus chinensis]|uniref:sialin-like n=1 Tax=Penaeus chinensis TaxID=139456 RepID=UPI001FB66D5B|nr:sialin-like [Penaeus chinensis]